MRLLVILLCFWAGVAFAVQPDEVLDNPALEERARDISKGLRCLVCRNESIDDSNADLARDLRLLVRERLMAGDDDREVIEFIVARYGEYVLLEPAKTGSNLLLWLAAPAMFLAALGLSAGYLRGRSKSENPEPLSIEEREKLNKILGKSQTALLLND